MTKMTTKTLLIIAVSITAAGAAFAQAPNNGTGRHGHHRRHVPPLVLALDANHDGVISADEIANASANLLKLDKNGDGQLTADELHPHRPADAPDDVDMPPPPHAGPLMLALDANGDGVLSAAEIANAPTSLKALDLNKDGQLTHDEFAPPPPDGASEDCPKHQG